MRAPLTALMAGLLLIPVGSLAFSAETDVVAPAAQKDPEPAATPALDKLGKRASKDHKTVDFFKGKSWYVAQPKPKPVPPTPPPPPPPPTAPPLPYAFMGSYLGKDGRITIYLTRGDQVFSVSPGDVLEGTYRVEGISSGQLGLIYLPLNIQQTISIGEAS